MILAFACALALSAVFAYAAPIATAPGQNKLLCFDGLSEGDGYGGSCTLLSKGAKGTALLDNTDGNENGSYSGVYVLNSNVYGQPLSAVTQLSFQYTGEPTAGSPRYSIPLDLDGNGTTDTYAFVSAYYCNDGFGLLDAINDPTCTIFVSGDANSYANWDAFVAAYPTTQISPDQYIFVIADDVGTWTVNNVKFGKAGK